VKLRIVAAGKVRPAFVRAAADDYLSRLRLYLPTEEVEVRAASNAKTAQAMLRAVPPRFELWALDAGGREPTSEELARWLEERMSRGVKGIAFVIGAAEGLPPEVAKKANLKLSLSKLTLPHRLARVLLLEQLYRAMTIIRGEPYNK